VLPDGVEAVIPGRSVLHCASPKACGEVFILSYAGSVDDFLQQVVRSGWGFIVGKPGVRCPTCLSARV
jgi:hypothetical protein